MAGELSGRDVEGWANAFEPRSDVSFGVGGDDEDVKGAIYLLANPALEGDLTHERAQDIIDHLIL